MGENSYPATKSSREDQKRPSSNGTSLSSSTYKLGDPRPPPTPPPPKILLAGDTFFKGGRSTALIGEKWGGGGGGFLVGIREKTTTYSSETYIGRTPKKKNKVKIQL